MEICKIYCDLCGKMKYTFTNGVVRQLNTLAIYFSKDDNVTEAKICSDCRNKIEKQIGTVKNNILNSELEGN